jgi:hypothetical protein
VRERGGAHSPRQDEFLEPRQVLVVALDGVFEPRDVRVGHRLMPRNRELAAQVEEIVLHVGEQLANVVGQRFDEDGADAGVELVDRADGLDARRCPWARASRRRDPWCRRRRCA